MKYVSDYVHSKGLLMGGYTDIGAIGYGITNSQIGSVWLLPAGCESIRRVGMGLRQD